MLLISDSKLELIFGQFPSGPRPEGLHKLIFRITFAAAPDADPGLKSVLVVTEPLLLVYCSLGKAY